MVDATLKVSLRVDWSKSRNIFLYNIFGLYLEIKIKYKIIDIIMTDIDKYIILNYIIYQTYTYSN